MKRAIPRKNEPENKRTTGRAGKKKTSRKGGDFYKFAIPLVMLVSTVGAVLIWSYSSDVYSDSFKGFASEGKLAEVYFAFLKDPVILLTTLGILLFDVVSLLSVLRAIKERKPAAAGLLILILASAAAFAAIVITAATQIAS